MADTSDQSLPTDRLKLVAEIARDLLAVRQPRELIGDVFHKLAAHLGLELYVNYLTMEEGRALRLDSCVGVPAETVAAIERGAAVEPLSGRAAAERAAVIVEDIQRSGETEAAVVRSLGLGAYAAYPLVAHGELIGTLAFGTRQRARLHPHERELLQAVADHVSLALERGRLLSALDEERVGRRRADAERALLVTREQSARAEAEEAGRIKDEFLAVLSHELRTPLNVMLGWVRLLRSGQFDPTQGARALEVVERNIRAQADLINELVDVSRMVSGTLVLDRRPTDLAPLVRAALDIASPAAAAKAILVRPALDGPPVMVMADAPRLQQAVLGVLNNAVKFTPSGGAITVRLESGHARARLSISDTGEGIPPERLPHIFDRNRAPDVSTTRAHAGLGRGLAIVRRLVELHGGSVRAESAGIRRGATFIIELPLSPPEARTAEAPAPPARELGTARLDGFRVLVVDDHADTRDLMSVILGKQGATVNAVGSVAEAHRLVGTFAPDVVLCDISMPGEDGFRLLEWVKEDERRQSRPIPVVAITAHAGPDDRRRVLAAGFKEYLPKPLELSDVTRVILRVAGRSRRA